MTASGGGYFDSEEFERDYPPPDYDHIIDAVKYGLGARYAGRHIPYEDLFKKPPPPPYGEMSLSDFKKWARDNDGIRANARSALDTLLEKHGITEADL